MNLNLGDTQLIIGEAIKHGLSLWETAYVLATAYHETAHTMKPVREYGGERYLKSKKYYPYVGMGYVQLTWKRNYELASKKFGVDFVANPKLLLEPKYAAPILVVGMKEGWFTGKSLKSYIDSVDEDDKEDLREFSNARRIINGTDKQVEIGKIALKYEQALKDVGYGSTQPQKQPQEPVQSVPEPEATNTPEKTTTLLSVLLRLIRMFLK
jgi:hypothetical protein